MFENNEKTMYTDLADYVMFSANKNPTETRRKMSELGLEYRKNKEFKDVLVALCKAKNHKYSFGFTELEIKAFATFLELDVVKKKRKRKADVI